MQLIVLELFEAGGGVGSELAVDQLFQFGRNPAGLLPACVYPIREFHPEWQWMFAGVEVGHCMLAWIGLTSGRFGSLAQAGALSGNLKLQRRMNCLTHNPL